MPWLRLQGSRRSEAGTAGATNAERASLWRQRTACERCVAICDGVWLERAE